MENPLRQVRSLQHEEESSFPGFFLVALIVLVGLTVFGACRAFTVQIHLQAEANDNSTARTNEASVVVQRRRAAARAVAEQHQQSTTYNVDNLVDGMSKSDREAFIKNFLKTDIMTMDRIKQMTMAEEVGEEQQAGSIISIARQSVEGTGSMICSSRHGSGFWSVGGDDGASQRYPHCPICLERLRVNEDIGLSQNNDCPHIFHMSCVTEWLMVNKDCPICRRKYLDISPV